MEDSERSPGMLSTSLPSDAEQQTRSDSGETEALPEASSDVAAASILSECHTKDDSSNTEVLPPPSVVQFQYSRATLLDLRSKPESQKPPVDWDLSHSSELYEPAVKTLHARASPPGPGHSMHGQSNPEGPDHLPQQRKDSWRGGAVPQPPAIAGHEGPIRSRLVENGSLGESDQGKGVRQVNGPAPRTWNQQQHEAEQNAHPGPPNAPRPARPMARKDSDQPERWNIGQAPGSDSWRGPPGLHGRGQGPEGRDRQWVGRGPPPPTPAGPVEVPKATPSRPPEREAPLARSLDKDWRSGKGRGDLAHVSSSKEWIDGYRNQPAEGHMRSAASSEQPERHDRPSHDRTSHDRNQPNRQQRGSRNNPEWMSDGGAVGEEDAAGLTAGARRAKDFEAERQRMKEEWRKEQAQLKGSTYQPVSMAEFMSDADLEALKADPNAEAPAASQGQDSQVSLASSLPNPPSAISQQQAEASSLAKFFGRGAQDAHAGLSVQQSQAFDFKALAQAAGQGLPQMPPMPKGVTTLEDLERHARASGQAPPPGFARPGLNMRSHPPLADGLPDGQGAAASVASPARPALATTPGSLLWGASDAHMSQDAAAQDSGKALLGLLSKAADTVVPGEHRMPTAVTPPPGFPAINKPQAPLSWGTSPQLQGIWGAPTSSSSGAQAAWGAPLSNTPRMHSSTAQSATFAQPSQGDAAEQPDPRSSQQSQGPFTPFMQAAHVPAGGLPEPQGSAIPDQAAAAPLLNLDIRTSSGAVQAEADGRRDSAPSHATNPLLAMLGQHRPSSGSKGEQDAQLQAFLQAQSGAYSWHPPQAAAKPQMQQPLMQPQQQQQQYRPQPAGQMPNAALSQDLLRQLQLGQSRMQAAATPTYPQQAPAGLHAYQQAGPAYLQVPRSAGGYGAHGQPNLQAGSQYGQQHQVPFNLGGAVPRASYGQFQGQVMGNQQLQHQLSGQGLSYSSAGSQAGAHLSVDGQRFSNQQATGSQAYGNNDLASQMLLHRLQQQSYSQAPQQGAGLDRFFNPMAFNSAQNARVPAIPGMQASLSELEAMMARQ